MRVPHSRCSTLQRKLRWKLCSRCSDHIFFFFPCSFYCDICHRTMQSGAPVFNAKGSWLCALLCLLPSRQLLGKEAVTREGRRKGNRHDVGDKQDRLVSTTNLDRWCVSFKHCMAREKHMGRRTGIRSGYSSTIYCCKVLYSVVGSRGRSCFFFRTLFILFFEMLHMLWGLLFPLLLCFCRYRSFVQIVEM